MTLNQHADLITYEIGKPDDNIARDVIKQQFKEYYSQLIRQSINKHGIDLHYIQRYRCELIPVDIADTCLVDVGCTILRTVNKIPTPVRFDCDVPFTFVGSIDQRITLAYTPMSGWKHVAWDKRLSTKGRYDYIDQYIYLFNIKRMKYATINAPYANPTLLSTANSCDANCYPDDMEFPCPEDLVTTIRQMILKEYGVIKPIDSDVPMVDNTKVRNEN